MEAHFCHWKKKDLVSHNYDLLSDNNDVFYTGFTQIQTLEPVTVSLY